MTVETTPAALMTEAQVVEVLDDLAQVAAETAAGLRLCAERAGPLDVKELFVRRAAECLAAVEELRDLAQEHGGAASAASAAAEAGAGFARGLRAGAAEPLLAAATQAGEAALEHYRTALRKDLPLTVLAVVQRQCEVAQRGNDDIQRMRERVRAHADRPRTPSAQHTRRSST